MSRRVSEVMTAAPLALPLDATLDEAARVMRDEAIGDVLVTFAGRLCGVLTDRDIVVRAVAEHRDTALTPLGDVCTADLAILHPEDDTVKAVRLMREQAVRRLPVVDGMYRPVGIVSIADLTLADGGADGGGMDGDAGPLPAICRAPPNN